MLSSQAVFLIMSTVAIFLVFVFYWRRFSGIRSTTRLHLKKTRLEDSVGNDKSKTQYYTISAEALEESNQGIKTKNLNVIFMYNGHSFEAHEILGIPAGANLEMIEQAYHHAMLNVDEDSKKFLEAALGALKENLKRN